MRYLVVITLLLMQVVGVAKEIDFVEDFALSSDREQALTQLIPGSEDYYYYHALHQQNQQQYKKVERLLRDWIKAHGHTSRVTEIKNRQALLRYSKRPRRSIKYLKKKLNVKFNHSRQQVDQQQQSLPSTLDQNLISRQTLLQKALRNGDLTELKDSAFSWLTPDLLNDKQQQYLLKRLKYPDYPQLVSLVAQQLQHKDSRGFGSLPIHKQLLQKQLEELAVLQPDLLNDTVFVNAYLKKLIPASNIDIQYDLQARQRYLTTLWHFANKLNNNFNSLKTHVLYHQLVLGQRLNQWNLKTFKRYLQIPRNTHYINPKYGKKMLGQYRANLRQWFPTGLKTVGDDEAVVRAYLQRAFRQGQRYQTYRHYIKMDYLKPLYAETQILFQLGKPEDWYAMLSAERYQALKTRVDIDFAEDNPGVFQREQTIQLDMWLKNVKQLMVKVYRINAKRFYQTQQKSINTDINLDGLVANWEYTYQLKQPEIARFKQQFTFSELTQPGIYVIDFIGNGKSSRALIRKGQLYYQWTTHESGQQITVYDESHQKLKNASVWLGGQEYTADKTGDILLPFSTAPGQRTIVLTHGDVVSLAKLSHQAENYQLRAGFYIDRENLIANEKATLVIRPQLLLNGATIAPSLLKEVKLELITTDSDGVVSSKQVELALYDTKESHYQFRVPERLIKLEVNLTAKIKQLSQNKLKSLVANQIFSLNQSRQKPQVAGLYLQRDAQNYVLEMRGLNGEPRPYQSIMLNFSHRDFKAQVSTVLQTDKTGQINLGQLLDITQVQASLDSSQHYQHWELAQDAYNYPQQLMAAEDQSIQLPYVGIASQLNRQDFALFSQKGSRHAQHYAHDHFNKLRLKNGVLAIQGLPAGQYLLVLKALDTKIQLTVVQDWLAPSITPLQMTVQTSKQQLKINVSNVNAATRVHVFATRYLPEYAPFDYFAKTQRTPQTHNQLPIAYSQYVEGRDIGDEYRYILERQQVKKWSGNLLPRPELLLNPWAIATTNTQRQIAALGDAAFAPTEAPMAMLDSVPASPAKPRSNRYIYSGNRWTHWVSYDFLAKSSGVWLNLIPDQHGNITLPIDALGDRQHVHIIAMDEDDTLYRQLTYATSPIKTQALRLVNGLPADQHYSQQQQIDTLLPEAALKINDIRSSEFEIYDDLAKVFGLYQTISQNSTLDKFSFIINWPQLTSEQKLEKYTKYACHELNFFLYHKDNDFFQKIIKPYLANKQAKTFMDDWLLGNQLEKYQTLWNFQRLNTAEKILLAQRLPKLSATVQRYINEKFELLPIDLGYLDKLFKMALKVNALDVSPKWKFAEDDDVAVDSISEPEMEAGGGILSMMSMVPPPSPKAKAAGRYEARAKKQRAKSQRKRMKYQRALYRELEKTQEWAENNYYKLKNYQQNAQLVTANEFWLDYAKSAPNSPFISAHLAQANRNFTEMMLALAVLDLPFASQSHQFQRQKQQLTVNLKSPAVVYRQQLNLAQLNPQTEILVSQNFFREGDRFRYEKQQKLDKYVTQEFLAHQVYGAQIVLTNPTSAAKELTVLLQVPQGSIPVNNSLYTRTVPLRLQPYQTQQLEYYFYFPQSGQYEHYPIHASHNGDIIAFAQPFRFNVVTKLSQVDQTSWLYVSQQGSLQQVLDYLKKHNIQRLDLSKIAFRMKDRKAFRKILAVLDQYKIFHKTLWSYSLKHHDRTRLQQYLAHSSFAKRVGLYLDSELLTINPISRQLYQHLEYHPLVNARTHTLGAKRHIVNDQFYRQYHQWLKVLTYKQNLTQQDLLATSYYLLLQDRIQQALILFEKIDKNNISEKLQYAYLKAYLAMYQGDFAMASRVAKQYQDYPILSWQKRFTEIQAQLNEIQGHVAEVSDSKSRDQIQAKLATEMPSFDFELAAGHMTLNYQNLTQVQVNYYPMNLELLFSNTPFMRQDTGQFSMIQPNFSQTIKLTKAKSINVPIPKQFSTSNVMIEVVAAGKRQAKAYYANNLRIQLSEAYGFVQVLSKQGKPLEKTYIKVYSRSKNGTIQFYKDGYTDWRGRFDYVSLSTDSLAKVKKFAILIMSKQQGAVVREVKPPQR